MSEREKEGENVFFSRVSKKTMEKLTRKKKREKKKRGKKTTHVLLELGAFLAVVGVRHARRPADHAAPALAAVVALVADADEGGRAHEGVADEVSATISFTPPFFFIFLSSSLSLSLSFCKCKGGRIELTFLADAADGCLFGPCMGDSRAGK